MWWPSKRPGCRQGRQLASRPLQQVIGRGAPDPLEEVKSRIQRLHRKLQVFEERLLAGRKGGTHAV
jgi:hypothetical protein